MRAAPTFDRFHGDDLMLLLSFELEKCPPLTYDKLTRHFAACFSPQLNWDSKLKFGRRLLLLGIQVPIPPKRYLPTGHHIGTPSTRTSVCKPQSQNVCCQVLIRTYEVEEDCCRR